VHWSEHVVDYFLLIWEEEKVGVENAGEILHEALSETKMTRKMSNHYYNYYYFHCRRVMEGKPIMSYVALGDDDEWKC